MELHLQVQTLTLGSSDGNVGIGTTDPSQALEVAGAIKTTASYTSEVAANVAYFDHDGTDARIVSRGADVDTLGGFEIYQQASVEICILLVQVPQAEAVFCSNGAIPPILRLLLLTVLLHGKEPLCRHGTVQAGQA